MPPPSKPEGFAKMYLPAESIPARVYPASCDTAPILNVGLELDIGEFKDEAQL
jgi:hypothetical protein